MSKLIGILYHPRLSEALELSRQLARALEERGYQVWLASAWEEAHVKGLMAGTATVVSVGGDGTVLRAARAILPAPIPILGVQYGRLGFLAEVTPAEALERVPALLEGAGGVEERTMLQASCAVTPVDAALKEKHHPLMAEDPCFHALNDVVVARGAVGRPIDLQVSIDGQPYGAIRGDGVIVATATGSTGYTLSAGGPVLHPTATSFVLTSLAPHATLSNPLVFNAEATVQLAVHSDHGAILSIDGQVDIPLEDGETVTVQRSPHSTRFLRAHPGDHFYAQLLSRLRFSEPLAP
ncbi:MAG: NAD(+)/NADH kinase [Chloroflexi bacterium]|nr:NAD(+)/NADH kinase [Chloroflexota bacterium]